MTKVMKEELKFQKEKFCRKRVRQGDKRHSCKVEKEKDRKKNS